MPSSLYEGNIGFAISPNIVRKDVYIIVSVNQDEAFYLIDRGHKVVVSSKTHKSRAKRYFAVESQRAIKDLEKYRQRKIFS